MITIVRAREWWYIFCNEKTEYDAKILTCDVSENVSNRTNYESLRPREDFWRKLDVSIFSEANNLTGLVRDET